MVRSVSSDVGTVMLQRRRQVGWDGFVLLQLGPLRLSFWLGVAFSMVGIIVSGQAVGRCLRCGATRINWSPTLGAISAGVVRG
jgi:hypothetical protein